MSKRDLQCTPTMATSVSGCSYGGGPRHVHEHQMRAFEIRSKAEGGGAGGAVRRASRTRVKCEWHREHGTKGKIPDASVGKTEEKQTKDRKKKKKR
jgi:hypothetical protein